jgi:hypothetical protein
MAGSPKWSPSLRFPYQNPVWTFDFPVCATCPAHLISRFDHPDYIGCEYRSLSSLLCSLLHFPLTLSVLGPNILSTLFSNTLSLCYSLSVRNHISHPYKTTGEIIVLYTLIFVSLDSNVEDKILHRMIASILQLQSALNCFMNGILFR